LPVLRDLGLLELCKKFLSFAKEQMSDSWMKVDQVDPPLRPCAVDDVDVFFWMVPLIFLADEVMDCHDLPSD